MQGVGAIVLAAGQGKRMKSALPKVLHRAAGLPLVSHVLLSLKEAGIDRLVVVTGQGSDQVRAELGPSYHYAWQPVPLGTGDAVIKGLPELDPVCGEVLVICGDTPLLTGKTIASLAAAKREQGAAAIILTSLFDDPTGYGRIKRNQANLVEGIVEEADAGAREKQIREINTGTYIFDRQALTKVISRLQPDNKQGEYYLTDCIALLTASGLPVAALTAPAEETAGINDRRQLAAAEAILRRREGERLMDQGVTIIDPSATYLHRGIEVGRDTVIYPGTFLEGKTRVGADCLLGPGTRIVNSVVGNGVRVQNSIILESEVGDSCQIGPFAYLRPGSRLAAGVKIGDFVELKKTVVAEGSKIPHLSYVGDCSVGREVNIGAGSITCNYDGVSKHRTEIGDRAFIGSNTNLVAPVKVGQEAITGAGSTITRDVPPGALAVERARQTNIEGWAARKKKRNHTDQQKVEGK